MLDLNQNLISGLGTNRILAIKKFPKEYCISDSRIFTFVIYMLPPLKHVLIAFFVLPGAY